MIMVTNDVPTQARKLDGLLDAVNGSPGGAASPPFARAKADAAEQRGPAIRYHANRLATSQRGRAAMRHVLELLEGGALDEQNQETVVFLLMAGWGPYAGSARNAMRDALGEES